MAAGEKLIASNPIAKSNFFLEERVEAGLALTGTEVKSMRQTAPNIRDSYVEVKRHRGALEAWLLNAHIAPYAHGNIYNHEPTRKRKLLLHKRQIEQLFSAIHKKGKTIIPVRLYFKRGLAKAELAIARGKKKHDRREDIKKKTQKREMDQAMKRRR